MVGRGKPGPYTARSLSIFSRACFACSSVFRGSACAASSKSSVPSNPIFWTEVSAAGQSMVPSKGTR